MYNMSPMNKAATPSLFERSRIVGVRFSPEEYKRLEAANRKRLQGWGSHLLNTDRAGMSQFIRDELAAIIGSPAQRVQVNRKSSPAPRRRKAKK